MASVVISMLGNTPEVEDIGQEVFIRFYRSVNKFRGDSSLGTYLTRIAINLSLNEIRRRKRTRSTFLPRYESDMESLPDKEGLSKRKEARVLVHSALQKLEPKFRTVIILRLIQGYSTEETATILGLPVGTVLSRLSRGQMKLKNILAPLYGSAA